MNVLIYLVC